MGSYRTRRCLPVVFVLLLAGCSDNGGLVIDQGGANTNGNNNRNENGDANQAIPAHGQFHLSSNPASSLLGTAQTNEGQILGFYGADSGNSVRIERVEVVENGQSVLINLDSAARPVHVQLTNGDRVEYGWTETSVSVTIVPAQNAPPSSFEVPLPRLDSALPRHQPTQTTRANRNARQASLRQVHVIGNIACEGEPRRNLTDVFIEINSADDGDLADLLHHRGMTRFPAASQGDGRYVANIPVRPQADLVGYCERIRDALDYICPPVDVLTALERGCAIVPQCSQALRAVRAFCFVQGIPILCDVIVPSSARIDVVLTHRDVFIESIETDAVAFSNLTTPLEIQTRQRCNESSACECFNLSLINACIAGRPCESPSSVNQIPSGDILALDAALPSDFDFVTWKGDIASSSRDVSVRMDQSILAEAVGVKIRGLMHEIQVPWQPETLSVDLAPDIEWSTTDRPSNVTYQWERLIEDSLVLSFTDSISENTTAIIQLLGSSRAFPIRLPVIFSLFCDGFERVSRSSSIVVSEPAVRVAITTLAPPSGIHYFPCGNGLQPRLVRSLLVRANLTPEFPQALYSVEVRFYGPDGAFLRSRPVPEAMTGPGAISFQLADPFASSDPSGTYRIVVAALLQTGAAVVEGVAERSFVLQRQCWGGDFGTCPSGYVMDEELNSCVCDVAEPLSIDVQFLAQGNFPYSWICEITNTSTVPVYCDAGAGSWPSYPCPWCFDPSLCDRVHLGPGETSLMAVSRAGGGAAFLVSTSSCNRIYVPVDVPIWEDRWSGSCSGLPDGNGGTRCIEPWDWHCGYDAWFCESLGGVWNECHTCAGVYNCAR